MSITITELNRDAARAAMVAEMWRILEHPVLGANLTATDHQALALALVYVEDSAQVGNPNRIGHRIFDMLNTLLSGRPVDALYSAAVQLVRSTWPHTVLGLDALRIAADALNEFRYDELGAPPLALS